MDPPGDEPDARFLLANERTFLAWNRTALTLVGAGLAVNELLSPSALPGGRRLLGLPLITVGAVLALASYWRWSAVERSIRHRLPLPATRMPRVMAVTVALASVLATILVIVGRE